MPRYLFNVFDGQIDTDKVGVELKSIEAARHETVRFAGEVLIADAKRMIPGEEWYLDVTDETGLLLFRLEVSFVEAVAAKRFRISH